MNYPIPPKGAEPAGQSPSVHEKALVDALEVVILAARANGQTLQDITAEVLAEDNLISARQRQLLGEIVAQAWAQIPEAKPELATVTTIAPESQCGTSLLAS